MCHCNLCQKQSGSAFAIQARFSKEQVTIEGKSTAWKFPIEGATPVTAFLRIVLPMSRNVLIAAGLFTVGTVGNDFMMASVFLLDADQQTVAAGLGVMDVSLEELLAVAGVNLAAIPVAAACAFFARGYVRGLTAAMVEGA